MSVTEDRETRYIGCDCSCLVMALTRFPSDPRIYVSVYPRPGKTRWFYRFKYMWDILISGDPYTDEIILNPKDFKSLIDWLPPEEG